MVTAPRVVKGMHDLLPAEARATSALEAAFRECMERARFGELRTPLVEQLSLFVRSVGAGTDIVDKIEGVKTGDKGGHGDVPVADVVIEKAVAL